MNATATWKLVPLFAFSLAMAGLAGGGCGSAEPGTETAISRGVATASPAKASSPCLGPLPSAALAVPAGNELEISLAAAGVQIYTCTATAAGPAWVFTAPEANLYDRRGALAGTHYAGPTWQSTDGSKVVGARIAGATADPSAVPWLLLGAASHAGDGRMDEVTFIQRVQTTGGIAPSTGCDVAAVGSIARIPYTATYCFYEADR